MSFSLDKLEIMENQELYDDGAEEMWTLLMYDSCQIASAGIDCTFELDVSLPFLISAIGDKHEAKLLWMQVDYVCDWILEQGYDFRNYQNCKSRQMI